MTWIPNKQWFDEFPTEPDTIEGLKSAASPVAERARDLTPVGTARRPMRDRYTVAEVDGEVYIGNSDPFFHLVEFGSQNNSPEAPLRRAASSLGLRFEEIPKA